MFATSASMLVDPKSPATKPPKSAAHFLETQATTCSVSLKSVVNKPPPKFVWSVSPIPTVGSIETGKPKKLF